MSIFFCLDCQTPMELTNGFYSIYYKCPHCQNRFTVHDANTMDDIKETGVFRTSRMSGFVIYDQNTKLIYARRRKHENDL
nr:hypothetical protein [uncultured Blautia sp.]